MSLNIEIPFNIERGIRRFAEEEHLSRDEAVLRLIETGLSAKALPSKTVFDQGLGLFGSSEDAALLDEIVLIAYEERRRPAKSRPVF